MRHWGRRSMPNIPLDWTTVDWTNVGLLSGIAFLAALLGNILIFRHRLWAAILAGLLFAAAYVFLVYYPHGLAVPGLKTGPGAKPGRPRAARRRRPEPDEPRDRAGRNHSKRAGLPRLRLQRHQHLAGAALERGAAHDEKLRGEPL